MNIFQFQILIIACLVSITTTLPGIFLVLHGVALMSDAISHAILPGIVIMFLMVNQLESPLLLVGACLTGILTVILTQLLIHTDRLKKDAAIGLIFPLFFSIGVLLIGKYARHVHLDTDMVLLGELAFAPFHRLIVNGSDYGPQAFWLLSANLLINSLFIFTCYKEMALSIFDKQTAQIMGFKPQLLYYILMTLTSITTVSAFDNVGSLVVVSLMITPAASAYLLSKGLSELIKTALALSSIASISGYCMAALLDLSIAGSIATMNGFIFMIVLLLAPKTGIIARIFSTRHKKKILAAQILNELIAQHHYSLEQLSSTTGWSKKFIQKILQAPQQ